MKKFLQQQIDELEQAIDTLERRRFALGDAAVEPELAPLRARLAVLRARRSPAAKTGPILSRRPIYRVEGIETSLIGRDAELEQLQAAFQSVLEDGRCRAITIVGEAGVGKSRLLDEFELGVEGQAGVFFKGRAYSEGQPLPYALLRNLFSYCFQILESDPPALVREKLERGLGEALGDGQDVPERSHLLGLLLGLLAGTPPQPVDPLDDVGRLRDQARDIIGDYFAATSNCRPVLLLLEDLDRADDSSLDALERLVAGLAEQPLLIIGTARPAFLQNRPHWGQLEENGQPDPGLAGEPSRHTHMDLGPLSPEDSRHLVDEILQEIDPIPPILRATVVDRAEGNPLYLQEIIKLLVTQGVVVEDEEGWQVRLALLAVVRIPPTLEGVIEARLEHLPASERTVLQRAAVMGSTFWQHAIEFMGKGGGQAGAALSALQDRELVWQQQSSAFAGTAEYVLDHDLLGQVLRKSLSKDERRVCHTRAAEWLMERYAERADTYAGLFADHLELARQPGLAAKYWSRAGEQAFQVYAFHEAQIFFERALALLPRGSSARIPLLIRAGEALFRLRNYGSARRRLENSVDLARRSDNPSSSDAALELLGIITHEQGDFDAARKWLEQDLALARQCGDGAREANALIHLGWVDYRLGAYDEARTLMEAGLAAVQSVDNQTVLARAFNGLAIVATRQEDIEAARNFLIQALELYRELGNRRGMAAVLNNLGVLDWTQQDYPAARQYYEQALDLFEKLGSRQSVANTLGNMGHVAAALKEYASARSYFCRTIKEAMLGKVTPVALEGLGGIAGVLAHTGQTKRALELLGLVLDHPALRSDTKVTLQPLLDELHERLPAKEIERGLARGRERRLEDVAREVLGEGAR